MPSLTSPSRKEDDQPSGQRSSVSGAGLDAIIQQFSERGLAGQSQTERALEKTRLAEIEPELGRVGERFSRSQRARSVPLQMRKAEVQRQMEESLKGATIWKKGGQELIKGVEEVQGREAQAGYDKLYDIVSSSASPWADQGDIEMLMGAYKAGETMSAAEASAFGKRNTLKEEHEGRLDELGDIYSSARQDAWTEGWRIPQKFAPIDYGTYTKMTQVPEYFPSSDTERMTAEDYQTWLGSSVHDEYKAQNPQYAYDMLDPTQMEAAEAARTAGETETQETYDTGLKDIDSMLLQLRDMLNQPTSAGTAGLDQGLKSSIAEYISHIPDVSALEGQAGTLDELINLIGQEARPATEPPFMFQRQHRRDILETPGEPERQFTRRNVLGEPQ